MPTKRILSGYESAMTSEVQIRIQHPNFTDGRSMDDLLPTKVFSFDTHEEGQAFGKALIAYASELYKDVPHAD